MLSECAPINGRKEFLSDTMVSTAKCIPMYNIIFLLVFLNKCFKIHIIIAINMYEFYLFA